MFNPRYFVRFNFEVCRIITNIPFFRGKHLNAMFKVMFSHYYPDIPVSTILHHLNIKTVAIENSDGQLLPGERISVVLIFQSEYLETVLSIISSLKKRDIEVFQFPLSSHFNPRNSLVFNEAICCRCQKVFTETCHPVSEKDLLPEIQKLKNKTNITVQFSTPLRLKNSTKSENTLSYINQESFNSEDFFASLPGITTEVLQRLPQIIDKTFCWIDTFYNPKHKNTNQQSLGGIFGYAQFSGTITFELAQALVYGQYTGLGKSTTIGFGFYTINEIETENIIFHNENPTLLDKIITHQNLEQTLNRMNNHSPGADGITVKDLKDTSDQFLNELIILIKTNKFKASKTIEYKKIKYNNQVRQISISNMTDRLIAKLISDKLSQIIDPILSERAYAYRPRRSVQQAAKDVQNLLNAGYNQIVKADVSDFFPSINTCRLFKLLRALLNDTSLVSLIESLYDNQQGLTQGNPLSPLLSNLYMKVFDDLIISRQHRYVRFADDMLVMTKTETELENVYQDITKYLNLINLELNEDKTEMIKNASQIEFLGCRISHTRINKIHTEKAYTREVYNWLPVFNYNYRKGIAVYITFKTRMARTEDTKLIIHKADETRESLSWSQINRFVVIGKARISAGVIRKALYHRLPVTFLTIRGKTIGSFHPNNRVENVKEVFNSQFREYSAFQLSFVRTIVNTKIQHQKMILQRSKIKDPHFRTYQSKIKTLTDIDEIRGYEGSASSLFFKHLKELVSPFPFDKREYHPAVGPINVLLSIGYSLIYHRVGESLISNGLNPYYGIYHFPRGRHMALASDLVECFRFIAERVMLSLIHLKKIHPDDFEEIVKNGSSYTKLNSPGMRAYLHRFEWLMNQEIKLKDENKTVKYEQLFDLTVNRLTRAIRLGVEFKPFKVR